MVIQSECGHCGWELVIEMNWNLDFQVKSPGADPLVFVPLVDFEKLKDPSIIDAF